jgi:hypothetical protein
VRLSTSICKWVAYSSQSKSEPASMKKLTLALNSGSSKMSPRGGNREGAGRKSRSLPKSKGIWCGQITDEQRDFIINSLSSDERFGALWAAANKAYTRRGGTVAILGKRSKPPRG